MTIDAVAIYGIKDNSKKHDVVQHLFPSGMCNCVILIYTEEAPNNIGESMDLDSLKGLVCHRNSGTTQGRIKVP